jgi:hypothetical protein
LRQAYDYWQNQPGNYLDGGRRGHPPRPPRGGGAEQFTRGREDGDVPRPRGPQSKSYTGPPGPSSFSHRVPQRAVRHTDDRAATGRRHGVGHTPPRRRIPAAGHVRDGYLPGLSPECVRITMAISQQSTGSTDACRATGADRTSVAFAIPIRAQAKRHPAQGQ